MSYLVSTTPILDGWSVEMALHQVLIAALRLEGRCEGPCIPEAILCGWPKPRHQRADDVRKTQLRPRFHAFVGQRFFANLKLNPSPGRTSHQNQFGEPAFRSIHAAFPAPAEHSHRASMRQTVRPRRFSKVLSRKYRAA